jgi:hypothetical protein
MRAWVIAMVASVAPTAVADSVAGEVSAGATLATPTTPATSWVGNRIAGGWDVDDSFEVRVDVGAQSAATAVTSELSLAYAPNRQWLFAVSAGWVPTSTTVSQQTLAIDDGSVARAALSATSTSTSIAISADYTAHDISGSLTVGVDHLQSQQTFASIVGADGTMLTADYLRGYCATHTCSDEIEAALHPLWSQLSQFSIDGRITCAEYDDVDLGIEAAYYLYDQDPRTAGHFRFPGPSNGTGMPIEPLRYAVSPTLATRWGKLRGTFGASYGSDVDGRGYRLAANVRFQYVVTPGVKLYARLAASSTVNDVNDLATSIALALGGNYAW